MMNNIDFFVKLCVFSMTIVFSFGFISEMIEIDKDRRYTTSVTTIKNVGKMSQIKCACECLSKGEECCDASYDSQTHECTIGTSGDNHAATEIFSGSSLLLKTSRFFGDDTTLKVDNGGFLGDWTFTQNCADEHYAVGFDLKIEADVSQDLTGLNAIKLVCRDKTGTDSFVYSGTAAWGTWLGIVRCDDNKFLTSFSLHVLEDQGSGDDTNVNYMKFRCRDFNTPFETYELNPPAIEGLDGSYRYWSNSCPLNSAICGLQTRIQVHQGNGLGSDGISNDDTALNDVIFFCCT